MSNNLILRLMQGESFTQPGWREKFIFCYPNTGLVKLCDHGIITTYNGDYSGVWEECRGF